MRVLVTGDREWQDRDFISDALAALSSSDTVIIEGAARGVDTLAHEVALEFGFATERYPAYWTCTDYEKDTGTSCWVEGGKHQAMHGKPAGVLRNQRMLDESKPDIVYAFHNKLKWSKGTADMVRKAQKAGIPVRHFSEQFRKGVML